MPLFFFKIFLMWAIFKVFIEFVMILPLFYILGFGAQSMWDRSPSTRDGIGDKNLPANAGSGFDSWSEKIPQAIEQLCPRTSTTEPTL